MVALFLMGKFSGRNLNYLPSLTYDILNKKEKMDIARKKGLLA
ncbi:hypothetical protein BACCIP111883_02259 [Sutcliffiella rhizosphaerae]|uniref:Uncharacterized protein n=1 Tax=Sutcliffiella rhizosphaerae TaxID=2880967 RepID=A0ABN8AC21_9BACI|nr:hypothetical protein BACCIP111883_02259 [Sutcliffiella rhizosphaerae]